MRDLSEEKDIILWIAYEDKIKITFKYGHLDLREKCSYVHCIFCVLIIIKQRKVFGKY